MLCTFPLLDFDPFEISVKKFEGKTSEGFLVLADKVICEINYLPGTTESRAEGAQVSAAFHLSEMSVRIAQGKNAETIRFGVVNFKFSGTEPHQGTVSSGPILPLSLRYEISNIQLYIQPLEHYEKIIKRVQTLKGVDVTCEVVGKISAYNDIPILERAVDDLCYILSVARGTKIQSIYCDQYNETSMRISRTHYSRITKPYSAWSIIDSRAIGREETKNFIEQAYGTYVSKRESCRFNQGTIDAYLDAKAEGDFLEMRGVKLAVSAEILKDVLISLPEFQGREFIIEPAVFNRNKNELKNAIDGTLKALGIANSVVGKVLQNISGLNRTSFREVLSEFCRLVGLEVGEKEIEIFVKCRNSLIHKGSFYCTHATREEKEEFGQLTSKQHEYHFLVNFLDRLFLKLFGYRGPYIDWREPGNPNRRELE